MHFTVSPRPLCCDLDVKAAMLGSGTDSSAGFQGLRVFFFLLGTIGKFFVPVVALTKGVRGGKVCFLVWNQEREYVVDHFTKAAKPERETQRCKNLRSDRLFGLKIS